MLHQYLLRFSSLEQSLGDCVRGVQGHTVVVHMCCASCRMAGSPLDIGVLELEEAPGAQQQVRVEREEHRKGPRRPDGLRCRLGNACGAVFEAEVRCLTGKLLGDGRKALGERLEAVREERRQGLGYDGLHRHYELRLRLRRKWPNTCLISHLGSRFSKAGYDRVQGTEKE